MRLSHLVAALATLATLAIVAGCDEIDPFEGGSGGAEISEPDAFDVSPPLRDLGPPDAAHPKDGIQELTTGASFEGLGTGIAGFNPTSSPPDPSGDIGPNHYVEVVNTSLAVFNRGGGLVYGPVATSTMWSGFPGACSTTNDGDARVRYDRYADRWVITQFSINGGSGPFYECIAVSTTGDPTGQYNRYQYQYSAFNDFPELSLWRDAYFITYNMYPNNTFSGAKVCAFDRTKMLAGQAATQECFDTTSSYSYLLAADLDGPTLPAAGAAAPVVGLVGAGSLGVWKFTTDFAGGSPTFTGPTVLAVSAYGSLCGSPPASSCVVQLGTLTKLYGLGGILMDRAPYRVYADHDALVTTHDVVANTGGGMRWYELRGLSTTPTLYQQGTYAPDVAYRWTGAVALNRYGDMGIGYSISSASLYPGLRYSGRLAGDAAGFITQPETILVSGGGYQSNISAWGYRSSLHVDPSDDCTFWYTGQYQPASGQFNWRTRVGTFQIADCHSTSVQITAPAAGSYLAGSVHVTAGAVDSDGIAKVDFMLDGKPLASDTTAPYDVLWDTTTATDAPHSLVAIATDGLGFPTASAPVDVTVDNPGGPDVTPPDTCLLALPSPGTTAKGSITFSAKATDSVGMGSVDLLDGATVVATVTQMPYATTWDTTGAPDGSHTLTATCRDAAGNTRTSPPVTINVKNNPGTTTQLLLNGGFEGGTLAHWVASGPVSVTTEAFKLGARSARIGSSTAFSGDASLEQTVLIPSAGVTTLKLYYTLRCAYDSHDYDQQRALVLDGAGNILVTLFDTCSNGTTWTYRTLDLTPYAGQTVKIHFQDHDDGYAGDPTWFYVDGVTVSNVQ